MEKADLRLPLAHQKAETSFLNVGKGPQHLKSLLATKAQSVFDVVTKKTFKAVAYVVCGQHARWKLGLNNVGYVCQSMADFFMSERASVTRRCGGGLPCEWVFFNEVFDHVLVSVKPVRRQRRVLEMKV